MELLDYQQKALNFIIDKDEALCALEMGLGKTFTAVKWLELKPVLNTIILCQSNKINDWYEEAVDVLGGKYNIIKIKSLKQLQELPINSGWTNNIIIMSYAIFTLANKNNGGWYFRSEAVWNLIIDESQVLKGHSSQISKAVLKFKQVVNSLLLLSGDPISNEYKDLYVQMQLLDLFPEDFKWWDFQMNYCNTYKMPNSNMRIINSYKNINELLAMLKTKAYFLKTEDAVFLPKQIFNIVEVEQSAIYKDMVKNKLFTYKEDVVVSDTPLKLMLNLREITSGFIYSLNHINKKCYNLDNLKIDAVKNLLLEHGEENFVIFYNFRAEYVKLKQLVESLNKTVLTINGTTNDWLNEVTLADHKNTVVLAHFQTGARGIDKLQYCFNKQIYYSLPLSGELYKQSLKRIHRLKQNKDCTYWTILMKNTIDRKILSRLEQSQNYTLSMFAKTL